MFSTVLRLFSRTWIGGSHLKSDNKVSKQSEVAKICKFRGYELVLRAQHSFRRKQNFPVIMLWLPQGHVWEQSVILTKYLVPVKLCCLAAMNSMPLSVLFSKLDARVCVL